MKIFRAICLIAGLSAVGIGAKLLQLCVEAHTCDAAVILPPFPNALDAVVVLFAGAALVYTWARKNELEAEK